MPVVSRASRRQIGMARRAQRRRQARINVRIRKVQYRVFDDFVDDLHKQIQLAAGLLRDQIKLNLSVPVGRSSSGRVVERSKPGEFPRLETGRLRRDIYFRTRKTSRSFAVQVGTRLDYGRILEESTRLNRSFIRRTYQEMRPELKRIIVNQTLVGRFKGGKGRGSLFGR